VTFGTYGQWWSNGFVPWETEELKRLGASPMIQSDASLKLQVQTAGEIALVSVKRRQARNPESFTRADFLGLFQGANKVKTILGNVRSELRWVEAIKKAK